MFRKLTPNMAQLLSTFTVLLMLAYQNTVTIISLLNISAFQIQNHFTTSIKVFRLKAKTTEMVLVGVVEPGTIYHVPLHAIYSEGKTLHFAIEVKRAKVRRFELVL